MTAWVSGSWTGIIELAWTIPQRSHATGALALVICTACVSPVSLLGSSGSWQTDGEASGGWRVALLWYAPRTLELWMAFRGIVAFVFLLSPILRNVWVLFMLNSVGGWVNFPHFLLDLSPEFAHEQDRREQLIGAERRKGIHANQDIRGKKKISSLLSLIWH